MNIIFQIDGGMGKSVMATAVCKAIRAQYPKDRLIVITGYPQVFHCFPGVRAYGFNEMRYFYEQYVQGQEIMLLAHNPYLETDFVLQRGHVIEVWCRMFGIQYNGEQPELYINNREQTFYSNVLGNTDKPILLLHTNGGAENQPVKYSWARDIPIITAQEVADHFAKDYTVVHMRRKDQLPLQNATHVEAEFRALAVLIQRSEKRLFMDSFAQHAAAALGKPSVVCWIGNTPSQFGYEMHNNIIANPPTLEPDLKNSVLSKYNISGTPIEFPYNHEREIFNIGEIIGALKGEHSRPELKTSEPLPEPEPEKKKKKEKPEVIEE